MLETIAAALLPALITVFLGYVAAWHHDFKREDTSVLNRMVLTYALPLALFVDTVNTPRAEMVKDLPLLLVLIAAVVGFYCAVFLGWRYLLRFSLGASAMAALTASAPNGPFVGATVLTQLFGSASGLPVATSGLLNSLFVTPVTIILLTHYRTQSANAANPHSGTFTVSQSQLAATSSPQNAVIDIIKQPVVWLPLLGFVILLSGLPLPQLAAKSLGLLGQASAGVALFATGIILSGYAVSTSRQVLALVFIKNIIQPCLVWAAVYLLGYSKTLLGEMVITAALPSLVLAAILSMQYRVAERESASALLISMLSSLVTLSGFIALTR
ncbi:MAG: AEC family transporter [Rhodomicrobium sp.]